MPTGRTKKTKKSLKCTPTRSPRPRVRATTTSHPTSAASGPRSKRALFAACARTAPRASTRMTSTTMRICTRTITNLPVSQLEWHSLVARSRTGPILHLPHISNHTLTTHHILDSLVINRVNSKTL